MLYADDPDAYVDSQITDAAGTNDFEPTVTAEDDTELTSEWLGDPAATRVLRTTVFGLPAGGHRLRLHVPGGNDVDLGSVYLR